MMEVEKSIKALTSSSCFTCSVTVLKLKFVKLTTLNNKRTKTKTIILKVFCGRATDQTYFTISANYLSHISVFQIWARDHIFIVHSECHWSRVCVLVVRCASSKREESEEIIEEYRERKVCAPPEHLEHLEEAY